MSNKHMNIAKKILKRAAHDIQEPANSYFATHRILDNGEHVWDKELKERRANPYVNPSNITVDDLQVIAKHASTLLDKELMKYNNDVAKESALGLAIKTFSNGKYDGKIGSVDYFKILNLMEKTSKVGSENTMNKTAQYYVNNLDKVANVIHQLVVAKKISAEAGWKLQMALDETSDYIETKTARTLENGTPEEKYMSDFGNDPATHKQDSDEPYMKDFHNGGQNIMKPALDAGDFDPKKTKVSSLDAAALAEKRK